MDSIKKFVPSALLLVLAFGTAMYEVSFRAFLVSLIPLGAGMFCLAKVFDPDDDSPYLSEKLCLYAVLFYSGAVAIVWGFGPFGGSTPENFRLGVGIAFTVFLLIAIRAGFLKFKSRTLARAEEMIYEDLLPAREDI